MLWEMSEQFSEKRKGRKSHGIFNNVLVGMKAESDMGGPYGEWALLGSAHLNYLSYHQNLAFLEWRVYLSNQSIIIIYLKPNRENS